MTNNMKYILTIVEQLQSTSSRTGKEDILFQYKDDVFWLEILKFVYNPYIVTGLSSKKINKKIRDVFDVKILKDMYEAMDYLKENNTGRDIDIFVIQQYINSYPEEIKELLTKIVTKDLSLGIDVKTINKIYHNMIPSFSVMLAHKYADHEHKVKGEFIITTKLDGVRCVIIKNRTSIKLFSRQGQPFEGLAEIEEEVKHLPIGVYDGELILKNDNNLNSDDLYRATVKVVRKDGIKKNIEFNIFDVMSVADFYDGYCNESCSNRKLLISTLIGNKFKWLKEVSILYQGNDKEVIPEMLNKAIKQGQEGLMLNVSDAPYECKRSSNILKIKSFSDADLRVTDILEGTGKNEHKLGAITVQFEVDGKVYECNCGSGFSDEERTLYWEQPGLIMGKIVTIGYFEISKNQQGTYGLRFPTWKGIIRDDKTEISMN